MSITANGLFSATTTAATSAWKPTNAAASAAGSKSLVASAFAPPAEADSVSVSPLGKALTGAAAKLFKELDSKTRGKLDDLVSTGVLKAEDVVKGLRSIAKDAVEERYRKELPLNAEETRQSEAQAAHREKFNAYVAGSAAVGREVSSILHDESFSSSPLTLPNGEMESAADAEKRTKEHDDKIHAAEDKIKAYDANFIKENGSLEAPTVDPQKTHEYRAGQNLRRAGLFDDESDRDIYSLDDLAAAGKLRDLGIGPREYADAAKKYAAGVDLSNIREVPPSEYPEPVQEAPVKKPGEDVAPGRPSALTTNTAPEKLKPFIVSYDVNGNAMAPGWKPSGERLQRPGLVSGTEADSAGAKNDAVLEALKQSLKDDGASAQHADAAERTDTIV